MLVESSSLLERSKTQSKGNYVSVLPFAAQITAAYASNPQHSVGVDQLTQVLHAVMDTLGSIVGGASTPAVARSPAPVEAGGLLVCLECKTSFKMLKRHLMTHKLTPGQYRKKHHLEADSPMIAGEYASLRSGLAVKYRLGHRKTFPTNKR